MASYSGLGATAKSSFRNLQISGQAVKAPVWDDSVRPARNWGVVDSERQTWDCGNIVRAANGELLLYYEHTLMHSADNGQNWTADDSPTEAVKPYTPHYTLRGLPDGRLERYDAPEQPPFKITKSISQDNGKTWSPWREVAEVILPPETPSKEFHLCMGPCRMLETKDGTLLLF